MARPSILESANDGWRFNECFVNVYSGNKFGSVWRSQEKQRKMNSHGAKTANAEYRLVYRIHVKRKTRNIV
jgi:hypothetical protein